LETAEFALAAAIIVLECPFLALQSTDQFKHGLIAHRYSLAMRIALAEPSQINRTLITRLLQAGGHEVRSFEDGPEALRGLAADAQLNAVITGSELKTMSGLELVWQARLLSGPRRFLYILFMSSLTDEQAVTEALDAGADDFIAKPPSPGELYARLRSAERIARLQGELIDLAFTDPLTGLFNRRGFFEAVAPMVATPPSVPTTAMLVDLDFLKEVNDLYGHQSGDAAILSLADALREEDALVGRLGGDEFGLLLHGYSLKEAAAVGEAIRSRFAASHLKTPDGKVSLTCSIGVAELVSGESVDRLFARADLALYKAKDAGRNAVETPPSEAWAQAHPRIRNRIARTRAARRKSTVNLDTRTASY
jgi:two-component system cell cycle response regulator